MRINRGHISASAKGQEPGPGEPAKGIATLAERTDNVRHGYYQSLGRDSDVLQKLGDALQVKGTAPAPMNQVTSKGAVGIKRARIGTLSSEVKKGNNVTSAVDHAVRSVADPEQRQPEIANRAGARAERRERRARANRGGQVFSPGEVEKAFKAEARSLKRRAVSISPNEFSVPEETLDSAGQPPSAESASTRAGDKFDSPKRKRNRLALTTINTPGIMNALSASSSSIDGAKKAGPTGALANRVSSPSAALTSGKAKGRRAIAKAKLIGKGLVEMERRGVKGLSLKEEYWSEAIYPEHEVGFVRVIKESLWDRHEGEFGLSFAEWESSDRGKEILRATLGADYTAQEAHVVYLSDSDRQQYHTTVTRGEDDKGRLTRNGAPYDTSTEETAFSGKGTAIFVIDAKGELFCGSHMAEKFHHSSFLSGGAVMGAGELKTNPEGQITAISNKSGHYRPTAEEMKTVLKALKGQGVDLGAVTLTLLGGKGRETYNAATFLDG